jgi:hypothetical protein
MSIKLDLLIFTEATSVQLQNLSVYPQAISAQ